MKRYARCLVKSLLWGLLISAITSALFLMSIVTPLFSTAGLILLNNLPIPDVKPRQDRFSINTTFNIISQSESSKLSPLVHMPTAYVVLGGGLTTLKSTQQSASQVGDPTLSNDESKHDAKDTIVLNQFSLSRVNTALRNYQKLPLPIVLTGVESPWMSDWLLHNNIENIITENASMNTCENARFTAKRLNLSNVYLITDAYHMTRARRQFALNGIQSIPIVAPLSVHKGWRYPKQNLIHSRRTLYELAAYLRDIVAPQKNCREADEVSLSLLMESRRPSTKL